jgi:hypothetical protein
MTRDRLAAAEPARRGNEHAIGGAKDALTSQLSREPPGATPPPRSVPGGSNPFPFDRAR